MRTEVLLLLCSLRLVINTGAWVLSWRVQLVLDFNRGLEELSDLLGGLKVTDLSSFLICMHVGVIESGSNRVCLRPTGICGLLPACIHIQIYFLRRY